MPESDRVIAEIGPGLGDLTVRLLTGRRVVAFEVDDDLCGALQKKFRAEIASGSFALHCGDVLKSWERENLLEYEYDLIANLPYYIATNIILRALQDASCKSILVMVQKEVAEKFSAVAHEREFCALSVLAQTCGTTRLLFDIEPTSFYPPPKVVSSILEIRKEHSLQDESFMEFLRHAFSQPRKKLLSNLSTISPKESLENIFSELRVDQNARPHQVGTQSYHLLYKKLKGGNDGFNKPDNRKRRE